MVLWTCNLRTQELEARSKFKGISCHQSVLECACLKKQKHDYLFCIQCLIPSGFWENQCPRFVEKLSPLYPLNDKTFFCSLHFSTALTTNYKSQDTVSLKSQGFLLFEAFVETDTKKAFAIWNSVRWGNLYLRTERKTQGCLVGITGGFSMTVSFNKNVCNFQQIHGSAHSALISILYCELIDSRNVVHI